ncbi:MAG: histidine phosphatase family protein [Clostridia bacterium]|nr:histidine phosphatase family protein [Clostridia bacterium]
MKILFLRHGETEWNREGKIQGGADIPLNAVGLRQAEKMRTLLCDRMPDCIIASPLKRALQTADVLVQGTRIPIVTDVRLRERGFGAFEGQPMHAVDFSGIWYPDCAEPPEGIEPLEDFVRRVADALRDIRHQYAGKRVLVVSHGGVSIAASILTHHTPQNPYAKALYIDNCSVAEYSIDKI